MTRFAHSGGPATSIEAAHAYEPVRQSTKAIVARYLFNHFGEWIDADTFNEIAGRAGDRRMRELRADGWKIEGRRVEGNRWQHRLVAFPDLVVPGGTL